MAESFLVERSVIIFGFGVSFSSIIKLSRQTFCSESSNVLVCVIKGSGH